LPRKTFDTKVMVTIGYLRWFFNYQREEIQLLLGARGIQISTGEISKLSEEFLLRFYTVHKKHSSQMKKLFETNKGYILHRDGSAEAGDEITFTAKEGITGITIDSWIMPSESRHYIKPFLQHIKDAYRATLVIIRDMSKDISNAASEVFPKVLHQICHSHYVRTQLRETKKHPHPFDFTQKPKKAKAKPLQNHYLLTHPKSAIFHSFQTVGVRF